MTIQQHTIDTPYMVGPVHCYTAELHGELVLFDTGPATEECKRYLINTVDLKRLKYIFITHCHIDHYGLAYWLEQETDATLYLPYRDGLKILSHEERLQDMYGLLSGLGFSGEYLDRLHGTLSNGKVFPPFPKKFRIIEDEFPNQLGLSYMSCPGHSQSDFVFYTDDWAVTGDALLHGVFQSPLLDADLETGERFHNYQAYCSTLIKLSALQGKRILPGHRQTVPSVDSTLLFYVGKLLQKANQYSGSSEELSVADILQSLYGDNLLEPFQIYLKTSEILFVKDFLNQPEMLKRSLRETGHFDMVSDAFVKATSTGGR